MLRALICAVASIVSEVKLPSTHCFWSSANWYSKNW